VEQYAMQEVPRDMALRRRLQHKSMDELRKLYFDWEPNPHNTTDTENRERLLRAIEIAMHQKWTKAGEAPEIRPLIFVLYFERELQKRRIRKRLLQRLEEGMVEEVQSLMQQGISLDTLEYYGLEYRYIGRYLTGRLSYNQMVEELNVAIRQFAKKQMTWFRRMEKKGHRLHWINGQMPEEEKLQHALQVIRNAKNSQT